MWKFNDEKIIFDKFTPFLTIKLAKLLMHENLYKM